MWAARDTGRIEMHLPASVLTDIYYIARKPIGSAQALAAIQVCLRRFVIMPVDRAIIEAALALPGADFEDNVQIACAQAGRLDLIITRNSSDFAQAGIPAIAPPEVPARLGT